ncbi:uncharacterized protein [Drosophila kikkawai]|uniref:Uncharacterized protein n=1 Tax=Drosophila kikkawai TaxID=30033 RepID=A0A6P4IA58_DROKI|nr:uncharacterized protein LOC108076670 [Drosophila kikkawai]
MGLKRFVSSMLRSAPLRSSKAGELATGYPSVFNEDGMWNAKMLRQVQGTTANVPMKLQGLAVKQQQSEHIDDAPYRLPRKRCWLTQRKDPKLLEKK